ncbi:MAG: phosphopantetheine-binding protein [Anderseniella sp.]|jgi:acyl carrier protein
MSTDAKESDISEQIREVIARESRIDIDKLKPEARLEDLEIESIDMVEILMGIEEKFDIYVPMNNQVMNNKCVDDVIREVMRLVKEKQGAT